jgi:hypothetical protein
MAPNMLVVLIKERLEPNILDFPFSAVYLMVRKKLAQRPLLFTFPHLSLLMLFSKQLRLRSIW